MSQLNKKGWLKKLVDFIYVFSKINGLIPIIYDRKISRFSTSWSSAIYSIIFTLIIIVLLLCLEIKSIVHYILTAKFFDFDVIMSTTEIMLNIFKTLILYTTQIFNQQRMVQCLNHGILLIQGSSKRVDNNQFIDVKFRRLISNRIQIVIVQIISTVLVFSLTYFIHSPLVLWILIGYTHVPTVLITGVVYFGGMIVTTRLYRILHQSLKMSFRSIKSAQKLSNHHLDDLSNEIEYISNKYKNVTLFVNNFNSLFGIHLTMTLVSCYVVVFNSVSCIYASERDR